MATVVVLATVAVLVLASGFAVALGAAISARHRAGAAADFAALAAARRAVGGDTGACRAAAALAATSGARLVGCSVRAGVVEIRVAVPLPGLLSRWGWVTADARAGSAAGRFDR
jgi:secretion/DNA translocation related TadE-like protein